MEATPLSMRPEQFLVGYHSAYPISVDKDPATHAVSRAAALPPINEVNTTFVRSFLRSGHIAEIPPSVIPIEEKFAKQHNE